MKFLERFHQVLLGRKSEPGSAGREESFESAIMSELICKCSNHQNETGRAQWSGFLEFLKVDAANAAHQTASTGKIRTPASPSKTMTRRCPSNVNRAASGQRQKISHPTENFLLPCSRSRRAYCSSLLSPFFPFSQNGRSCSQEHSAVSITSSQK